MFLYMNFFEREKGGKKEIEKLSCDFFYMNSEFGK